MSNLGIGWEKIDVIYPDKVRLNKYYYEHYYSGSKGLSGLIGFRCLIKDLKMIFATVLGKRIVYAGEVI